MEEKSEDEAESFEDKCTFLSLFHFLSGDFDIDSHDFDFDTLRNKANVKENLHQNLEHWHQTGANLSVIDIIENSYKIPFFTTPDSNIFQNNQSPLQNENFVTCTVKESLKSSRIKETRALPQIVNLLTVSKSSCHKPRFILDLRYVSLLFCFVLSFYLISVIIQK